MNDTSTMRCVSTLVLCVVCEVRGEIGVYRSVHACYWSSPPLPCTAGSFNLGGTLANLVRGHVNQ